MTNEIKHYEEKWIILMKSGLVHWVTRETGEKAAEHLANQSSHTFLRIRELGGIAVNTAEMEGAYTHKQYDDICRIKSGEWQCAYGNWHKKKGGECSCRAEAMRREAEAKRKKEEAEASKPMTPEEQQRSRDMMTKMSEMSALDDSPIFRGMFRIGNKDGRTIRKSTIEEWERKNGRKANLEGLAVEGIISNDKTQ